MQTLEQQRVLVVGGSRGLGLGVAEALIARHANVTVLARDAVCLRELKSRLGVSIIPGDATDPTLAESALRDVRPSVLVVTALLTDPKYDNATAFGIHGETGIELLAA